MLHLTGNIGIIRAQMSKHS